LLEHDLFGKPVSTFPDHALGAERLRPAAGEDHFSRKIRDRNLLAIKKSSGRILIQPLPRNTAQGASRNQHGATPIRRRGLRAHHVFYVIIFLFVGLAAIQ
jgi:hypothetical protein